MAVPKDPKQLMLTLHSLGALAKSGSEVFNCRHDHVAVYEVAVEHDPPAF